MTPRKSRPNRSNFGGYPARRIIVFVEGEETERRYVNHWRSACRGTVIVNVPRFYGSPKQLVERAVKEKRNNPRAKKRRENPASDEYWCVFDGDKNGNLSNVLKTAKDNDVHVAMSNPCIELWFILHFQDQNTHIESDKAQSLSKRLLKCGKALTTPALEILKERFSEAKDRAEALDRKHELDDRPARSNPSSDIWRLIDSIMRED